MDSSQMLSKQPVSILTNALKGQRWRQELGELQASEYETDDAGASADGFLARGFLYATKSVLRAY